MCRLYVEDMIDFRVSDIWRDDYFERGLTPFHSPGYQGCRDRQARRQDELDGRLNVLADIMQHLAEHVAPSRPPPAARPLPPSQPPGAKHSGSMNL